MAAAEGLLQELRRKAFLARLYQLTDGDATQRLNAGDVGAQLAMPLEHTLTTVAQLHEEGLIHRCGKLDPPHGPEVHLTAFGILKGHEAARWGAGIVRTA